MSVHEEDVTRDVIFKNRVEKNTKLEKGQARLSQSSFPSPTFGAG